MTPDEHTTPQPTPAEQPTQTPANPALISAETEPPEPKNETAKSIFSTILILLMAPVIALVLMAFVFQSYEVDGSSMQNTLQDKDRLIVIKVARTWSRITGHAYIPKRGDVIVFNKDGLYDASGRPQKQLIKRVIGLPGDRVVVQDGHITIYNNEHPGGFDPDKSLPAGTNLLGPTENDVDVTVPANEVFVCGDHRNNSYDSRFFGTVPSKDIVGKLELRLFPLNKAEVF